MLAQDRQPTCPADRPIDDLIAEVQTQAKQKTRNRNPLPDDICIFNWCSRAKRPHSQELAKDAAQTEAQKAANEKNAGAKSEALNADGGASDFSSSKNPEAKCDAAMEAALAAAHDVEVADYQVEQKNYKGALLRYQAALTEKPGDAAIHVRLGRVLERMNEVGKAIEHYQEAQRLAGPAKWSEEAKSALLRLRPPGT